MSHHDGHGPTHPYHLVDPSPWPAVGAFSLLMLTFGGALYMHGKTGGTPLALAGFVLVLYCMYGWWKDVTREAVVQKAHTPAVARGLRAGMGLFITSEVLFFVVFFWAFFGASTLPRLPLVDTWAIAEGVWPPAGIKEFDPFHLPLLNTLILLLSGTTVTWAHYAILQNDQKSTIKALWYSVILGVLFTACQVYEYTHAAFGFKDGIYASTFYMATGFHGFHVLVGTIFLAVCLGRAYKGHFKPERHLGFEFAAWYWHFVDVVWLFLFIFVYLDFANKLMPAFQAVFTAQNLLILFALSMVASAVIGYKVIVRGGLKFGHH